MIPRTYVKKKRKKKKVCEVKPLAGKNRCIPRIHLESSKPVREFKKKMSGTWTKTPEATLWPLIYLYTKCAQMCVQVHMYRGVVRERDRT